MLVNFLSGSANINFCGPWLFRKREHAIITKYVAELYARVGIGILEKG